MTTERVCSVDGCSGKHRAKGLCQKHYKTEYAAAHKGEIAAHAREYYAAHREERLTALRGKYLPHPRQASERVCSVDGCGEKHLAKGLCSRHYTVEHKDEIAAHNREYRATHKDEIATRRRKYYSAHKGERTAYYLEWKEAHKKELASYKREYAAAHKDKRAAYVREYRATKPEVQQAAQARRRHRATATLSQADKDLSVLVRKGFRVNREPCAYCGTEYVEGGFHVDHEQPIARGGTDHWWNLVHSCATCNLRKGTKTGDEFREVLAAEGISAA